MDFDMRKWDIGRTAAIEWGPWGGSDLARAKVLASGDGFHLALVEAQPGYVGEPHEHRFTEFLFVVAGTLQSNGEELSVGDGYVASAGSTHQQFWTDSGATYVSVFKL